MADCLVEVRDLCKYFPVAGKKTLKAVDHVSFTIEKGQTLGIVGESGCGKTTCGRTLIGLYPKTSGEILFAGQDVTELAGKERLRFKKRAQMIFQDPYSSLDPRMTIAEIVAEGLQVHTNLSRKERQERAAEELLAVGLTRDYLNRFAHELSGGQRQRVGIARALAVEPEFIVCDEPISALDVSIQAQIVNLLIRLQKERGLTYLFISHDLSMVRHISDYVGIMYLGALVEYGTGAQVFSEALHPYTKALISAIPDPDPDSGHEEKKIRLSGEVPSPVDPPPGCRFAPRCAFACEACHAQMPAWEHAGEGRYVACHRWKEIKEKGV